MVIVRVRFQLRHNIQYVGLVRNTSVLSGSSSFDVRERSGPSLKSALQHTLGADLRDDPVFPSCGSFARLVTEIAGFGGDVGFAKNELYLQGNCPLARDSVSDLVFIVTSRIALSNFCRLTNSRRFKRLLLRKCDEFNEFVRKVVRRGEI